MLKINDVVFHFETASLNHKNKHMYYSSHHGSSPGLQQKLSHSSYDADKYGIINAVHTDVGHYSNVFKCADDIKLFRKIKGNDDKQQLQDSIDKLIKWSEKLQMLFNFEKCKCLHAGHGNTGVN